MFGQTASRTAARDHGTGTLQRHRGHVRARRRVVRGRAREKGRGLPEADELNGTPVHRKDIDPYAVAAAQAREAAGVLSADVVGDTDDDRARAALLQREVTAPDVQVTDGAGESLDPPADPSPVADALTDVDPLGYGVAASIINDPDPDPVATLEGRDRVLAVAMDHARVPVVTDRAVPTTILAEMDPATPGVDRADFTVELRAPAGTV